MQKEVCSDISSVLLKVIKSIRENDYSEINELSNHLIHNASIFQDKFSVETSIIVYSLSKIFEKNNVPQKDFWKKTVLILKKSADYAIRNNEKKFSESMLELAVMLKKADKDFEEEIGYVLEKARVSKAGKIHEHGISLGRVAELLGISEWEAMDYIGKNSERKYAKEDVKKRYSNFKSRVKKR